VRKEYEIVAPIVDISEVSTIGAAISRCVHSAPPLATRNFDPLVYNERLSPNSSRRLRFTA
jgi:hypothetical protein